MSSIRVDLNQKRSENLCEKDGGDEMNRQAMLKRGQLSVTNPYTCSRKSLKRQPTLCDASGYAKIGR